MVPPPPHAACVVGRYAQGSGSGKRRGGRDGTQASVPRSLRYRSPPPLPLKVLVLIELKTSALSRELKVRCQWTSLRSKRHHNQRSHCITFKALFLRLWPKTGSSHRISEEECQIDQWNRMVISCDSVFQIPNSVMGPHNLPGTVLILKVDV